MIKRILPLLFFFIGLSLVAQQPDYNNTDAQGRKQGPWKKFYPTNDGLFYEGQFKDDKPVGVFKHYYETGELKSLTDYSEATVRSKVFYPKGSLMAMGNFIDRKKDSIWTYFDEVGWVSMRENYKEGMREGESTSYYPDGSVAIETTYLKDKENGSFVHYYRNGNKEAEGNNLGGEYNGEYIYYYDNGKKMHSGEFNLGKRNGKWIFYNTNGSIKNITQYRNGVVASDSPMNGEFIVYYDSGMPKSIYNYKNGKKHGVFTEYYDQGEMVLVPREKANSYEPDEFIEELQGQQVKHSGSYKEGVLVGEELFFSEEGRLLDKKMH